MKDLGYGRPIRSQNLNFMMLERLKDIHAPTVNPSRSYFMRSAVTESELEALHLFNAFKPIPKEVKKMLYSIGEESNR